MKMRKEIYSNFSIIGIIGIFFAGCSNLGFCLKSVSFQECVAILFALYHFFFNIYLKLAKKKLICERKCVAVLEV